MIWKSKQIIDKYVLFTVIISLAVAILIHFPESVSLFDRFESHTLFPGMRFADVANEIAFTFLSLLLLFMVNTWLFHFNRTSIRISWQKIASSFILTWILSSLLEKGFRNQYEALKNQLNPHMLFNSLNTLRSLVREDQERAQEYIQELSRVLRYTLQGNESQSVTLREEMNFVSAYIFLLKMRYEDNLIFDIDVSHSYENYYLPPMAIQVLIENAVKHNEISSRHPLSIRIATGQKDEIVVSNPIQPKLTASSGTGIGLANLAKRYQLLFKQEISISDNKDFTVRIPLTNERP